MRPGEQYDVYHMSLIIRPLAQTCQRRVPVLQSDFSVADIAAKCFDLATGFFRLQAALFRP